MMNFKPKHISVDELLQRVGVQPEDNNIWLTSIVSPSNFNRAINELKEMLPIFLECDIGVVSAEGGVLSLFNEISDASQNYLLIRDFELWLREDWQKFDALRSRLDRQKRGGTLVLSLEATKNMLRYAPNFTSWLGSGIFCLLLGVEFLTIEERQSRLLALHKWSGQSDMDIIALAESHKLPSDPEYGEWLILLEREDLIER